MMSYRYSESGFFGPTDKSRNAIFGYSGSQLKQIVVDNLILTDKLLFNLFMT